MSTRWLVLKSKTMFEGNNLVDVIRTRVALGLGRRIERLGRYKIAARYYERTLSTGISQSSEIQFRYGFSLYKCKQYTKAMHQIEAAIARQPHRYGWIQTLALTMQRLKKYERALELFEAACQGDPSKMTWRIRWARCARVARKGDLASSVLDGLVSDFPDDPKASSAIATFLLNNSQRWRELDVRVQHENQHADDPKWFFLTAQAATYMSRFEQAEKYYRKALELDDSHVNYWYGLGRSLEEQGKQDEAEAAYSNAVLRSRDKTVQSIGIGKIHEREDDWNKALDAYETQLSLTEENNNLYLLNYRAGEAATRLFEFRQAADYYQRAQNLADTVQERVLAGYAQGRVLSRAGDFEAAEQSFSQFVDLLPEQKHIESSVALFRYAHSLHQLGRFAEASERYLQAASDCGYLGTSFKGSKAAGLRANEHRQRAAIAAATGDWSVAARSYSSALWHASSTERQWQARAGQAYAKLGEFEKACQYFVGMILFTEISVAGLGDALKGVGRRRGALAIHAREVEELDEHLVLFESSHGKNVHCHPYAIYRGMRQDPRFANFRYAWVYNEYSEVPAQLANDPDVAVIKQHSDKYIRLLGTAKYLINNATFPTYFARREGQQVLNTWHGTPLKFMGKLVKDGVAEHRNVQRNFLQTTHMMVPNAHTLKTLSTDHDLDGLFPAQVALTGSPRIDQMVNMTAQRRNEILTELGIDPNNHQKIVLFAPTWRGQLKDQSYDVSGLVEDLATLAQGEHHMLFRAHRFAEKLIGDAELDATVVPSSIDTNELLAVIDVLITDYSSIFYDFLPAKKPVIFYTPDFEAYEAERGLYFERSTWPGEVLDSIQDVATELQRQLAGADALLHPNFETNLETFASMEDGHAVQRVIEFFFFADQSHVLTPAIDERTKLLFFQGPFKPNGIATAFTNLIGSLDPEKYLVSVAVDMGAVSKNADSMEILSSLPEHVKILPRAGATIMSAEERHVSDGYHAHRGFDSPGAENVHMQTMTREMQRSFGDAKFDAAINFEGYSRFWASLFAAARNNAERNFIYLHNDMVGEWKLCFGTMPGLFATYRHYDQLVSVTNSVGEQNEKELSRLFGIDPEKFTVSENLLDLEKPIVWSTLEESVHVFDGVGLTVFANMARLSPEKGQMKLLQAFAKVHEQNPDTRLLLIGDGPLRSDLENEIRARGLTGHVVVTGLLANPFPTLKTADCFVFSSDYEGQGLAMIEAMMLGMPAISTDVVGSRSVLEGGFGLLVENSADGLAEGMIKHLNGFQSEKTFNPEEYQASALSQFERLVEPVKV
ncbi:CDP-glycerol glycerophosphotransferase family protein [Glutamicibacter sp. M10]|uniref:CDP-glycerol glycerophosphotransferase family protein n=1 Tax=Glutamicibacter sp. M10 TaxID=3023076 RepID=UPI0021C6667F|nr:CDP-glycerol glycerophosphotransferase family protein [Glutamicibacter sp. M10]UXN31247.1 CDP-glycerol glycerophosphotransferase family protein [Glutamicibacter sp. M10]